MIELLHRIVGFDIFNIYDYPPVQFWYNTPSLAKIPSNYIQNPPFYSKAWWYWHRQEYLDDNLRPKWWPMPIDLIHSLWLVIIYSLCRILFNRIVTQYAVRTMNLSKKPNVDSNSINKQLYRYIRQIIDKQQRITGLSKRKDNVEIYNRMKVLERDNDRLHSTVLQYISTLPQYKNNTKQQNNDTLKQYILHVTMDSIREVKIRKFLDAAWLFLSYVLLFIYGCYVTSTKPYVWDLSLLWHDWPNHRVPNDVYVYYLLQITQYLHLLIAEFVSLKKKDFIQMTIHHCVTLLLLFISYMMNFTRIGVLILVIHDASDVFLEFAKLCNYTQSNNIKYRSSFTKIQDMFFIIFAIVFIFTRLYIYPFYIYHAMLVRSQQPGVNLGMAPVYWVFAVLLGALVILHIIWGSIILKMCWQFVAGTMVKDARSDDELDFTQEQQLSNVADNVNGNLNGNSTSSSNSNKSYNNTVERKRSRASSTADSVLNEGKRSI